MVTVGVNISQLTEEERVMCLYLQWHFHDEELTSAREDAPVGRNEEDLSPRKDGVRSNRAGGEKTKSSFRD